MNIMNITLHIQNNKHNETKNFQINEPYKHTYFDKVLKALHQFNGIIFVKYFEEHVFKIACCIEGYTIIIKGESL